MAKSPNGFGSIRKKVVNGKTYYEGRYTDPILHKQKSVSAPTQKECREKLMKVLAQIEQGAYVTPNKTKVREWAGRWLDGKIDIREGSRVFYNTIITNHIIPFFGDMSLRDLRPVHCQEFVHYIAKKKSPISKKPITPKYIKNVVNVLHQMLDDARRLEVINSNPAESLIVPKIEKKEIKVIVDGDQAAFIKAITGHRMEAIFTVALHTGARISEVLGLTWKNINFDTGEIIINAQLQRARNESMQRVLVPTKSGNHRTVIVPKLVIDILAAEKKRQAEQRMYAGPIWSNDLGLVFTREDGSPIPHTTVANAFKKIASDIGRPELSLHALRHTYATEEIAYGTDPKTVASSMGHSRVNMTLDVYATTIESTKKSAAERRQQRFEEKKALSN